MGSFMHLERGRVALLPLLFILFTLVVQAQTPPYKNAKLPVEERVKDLLSRMTPEEKVAQLQCTIQKIEWGKNLTETGLGEAGPVLRSLKAADAAKEANVIETMALEKTRLGIPVIIHDEAVHGLLGNDATSFPQAIGLAATWDPSLMERVATVIGKETRSRGIRQVLSPVVNIARDVRWGRVEETYGEDPYLSSRMGVAFCKAIESQGVITTPKHFVANVGDGGRDSNPIHFSERELREVYFPPFKACFEEGHAGSVMPAYNAVDDIPCASNSWLLRDVLRKEWGFKGFVVSDYGAVDGILNKHHVAATAEDAAVEAVEGGMNVELPSVDIFGAPLLAAVKSGRIPKATLDEAVAEILRAKFRLGLFDHPHVDPEAAAAINDTPEHRALALEAAEKTIVLLKNEHNILPLKKSLKRIAVIGPLADTTYLGGYSGFGMKVVSLLDGIRAELPDAQVAYAHGAEIGFTSLPTIPAEFLAPPNAKPGEHGLRGEYFDNKNLTGTPRLVRIDKDIQFEWAMGSPDSLIGADHFSVRWTGTLTPNVSGTYTLGASTDDGVRLWLDGKLLINSWFDRGATLDVVTLKLEAGRPYNLKIEYYENEGWAYASLGWRLEGGPNLQLQAAVDAARNAEAAIIGVGITEGEGYDRANLDLPASEEELINAVAATGTPTVVVLIDGSAVTMRNWIDKVPAILEGWYDGEEGGTAIAKALFGDVNPGGKLPITFPQFVGQVPLYYNYKPTGRGYDYADMSGKPQFPFGYGLSYTTFAYSDLRISPTSLTPDGTVDISVKVENTGSRTGDEVVQLYTHQITASVARPLKELKGFERVSLEPGKSKTVRFTLRRKDLSYPDRHMKEVLEPGPIEVMIGSSSDDIRVKSGFDVAPR